MSAGSRSQVRENRVELEGRLAETSGLRHTPAGIPTLRLRLLHVSEQQEAGRRRQVECEVEALCFGEVAAGLARLAAGTQLRLAGFLDRKGAREPQAILHVTEFVLPEE